MIVKNLFWFVLGVVGGVVAAHFVNKSPRGHELLAQVDESISEFTDRIGAAYREQEARISGLLQDVESAASTTVDAARDAAAPVAAAAADAATAKTSD